jgi:hypothetical protein
MELAGRCPSGGVVLPGATSIFDGSFPRRDTRIEGSVTLKDLSARLQVAIATLVAKAAERSNTDEIVAVQLCHHCGKEFLESVTA